MKAAIPESYRPLVEPRLPCQVAPLWYRGGRDAERAGTDASQTARAADVAWIDLRTREQIVEYVTAAPGLRWVFMHSAGVERFPFDVMNNRSYILTNGAGLSATPVAEFVVMAMLASEKNLAAIVRAHDRHEWLSEVPGRGELYGSHILILGYGGIGQAVAARLRPFGAVVTAVRRNTRGEEGVIGPDDWRPRLPEFDWIIVAAASMPASRHLIGKPELALTKPGAKLINVARGALVDESALVDALTSGRLAGAYIDVTDPEPAPPSASIWSAPNAIVTSHLSGRATHRLDERAADLFLTNLDRYLSDQPLFNVVDQSAWLPSGV